MHCSALMSPGSLYSFSFTHSYNKTLIQYFYFYTYMKSEKSETAMCYHCMFLYND